MRGLFVLLLIVLTAPAATAQKSKARDEARQHFAEGKRLQEAGEYDRAIVEYRAANDLAPHPELIFNIGQCQRLKGDKAAAIASYEQYLALAPKGRAMPEAVEHIAALKRAVAEEEGARATPPPAPAPPPPVAAPPPAPLVAVDRPAAPGRTLRIAGLATAGGGALLLVAGGIFALRASSIAGDVDALDAEWDPELYDSGKRARTLSIVFLTTGVAAAATGAVLYYLGVRADRRERVTLLPAPGGASLLVRF